MAGGGKKRPTVIVADDHPSVHPLLSRILTRELEVIDNVFDGLALLESADRHCPDLIVVDVCMPGLDGIEAVKRLRSRYPALAVVVISTDVGEEQVRRAMKAGADVFISKASAAENLLPAARAALRAERA
jgi:CheY-like chemotaxis protein